VRCCDVFEKIRVRSSTEWVAGEATVQVKLWPRDQERTAVKEGTRLYGGERLKRETNVPDEGREGPRCPNGKSKARFPLAVVEGRPKRSGSSRGAECRARSNNATPGLFETREGHRHSRRHIRDIDKATCPVELDIGSKHTKCHKERQNTLGQALLCNQEHLYNKLHSLCRTSQRCMNPLYS
jgi:hypothetical protein